MRKYKNKSEGESTLFRPILFELLSCRSFPSTLESRFGDFFATVQIFLEGNRLFRGDRWMQERTMEQIDSFGCWKLLSSFLDFILSSRKREFFLLKTPNTARYSPRYCSFNEINSVNIWSGTGWKCYPGRKVTRRGSS